MAHGRRNNEEVSRSNRNSRISTVPPLHLLDESFVHGTSSVAQIRERARMSTIMRLDTASIGDEEKILEREESSRKKFPDNNNDYDARTPREDIDQ